MTNRTIAINLLGRICCILFSAIGVVNMFRGERSIIWCSPVCILSLVYYPPLHELFSKLTGYRIRRVLKVALALFLFWASIGVGKLFNKIDLLSPSL